MADGSQNPGRVLAGKEDETLDKIIRIIRSDIGSKFDIMENKFISNFRSNKTDIYFILRQGETMGLIEILGRNIVNIVIIPEYTGWEFEESMMDVLFNDELGPIIPCRKSSLRCKDFFFDYFNMIVLRKEGPVKGPGDPNLIILK